MTVLDFLMKPELVTQAWDYFSNVQTKNVKYTAACARRTSRRSGSTSEIMAQYRPEMKKYYYDPTKCQTYLEQLGIDVRRCRQAAVGRAGRVWQTGRGCPRARDRIGARGWARSAAL